MADAVLPAQGEIFALLRAISPEVLALVLMELPAIEISKTLTLSKALRVEVLALVPMVLRDRGLAPGSSLRTLARADREHVIYEDFASTDEFFSRWHRGPSAPPDDQPAYYRALAIVEEDQPSSSTLDTAPGSTLEICSAVDTQLPIERGCRVLVEWGSRGLWREAVVADVHVRREGSPLPEDPSVEGRGLPEGDDEKAQMKRTEIYAIDWVGDFEVGDRGLPVRRWELRLLYHPRWDASPRRCLRLDGGWRMNFSGVHRLFAEPIRPQRISFSIKLARRCASRAFFNFFLSSAAEPYADEAVFWCGSAHHPPVPSDVFTLLFDAQADGGQIVPQLWLPSGVNAEARRADGEGFEVGEWHRVVLEFSWSSMALHASIDGEAFGRSRGLYFGPHESLVSGAAGAAADEDARATAIQQVQQMLGGFRRLFLFTWLEDADTHDVPDVSIGDLWIEGRAPPPVTVPVSTGGPGLDDALFGEVYHGEGMDQGSDGEGDGSSADRDSSDDE
jgi:hypothetical protein